MTGEAPVDHFAATRELYEGTVKPVTRYSRRRRVDLILEHVDGRHVLDLGCVEQAYSRAPREKTGASADSRPPVHTHCQGPALDTVRLYASTSLPSTEGSWPESTSGGRAAWGIP
jgi:hypothetical protein